jgi:peptide deformylase
MMLQGSVRLFGDPVLRQRSREVEELDGSVSALVNGMYSTMYAASGVGLAAPQVGVQKRLFTYDVGEGPKVLINPVIVESSGHASDIEGCLSIPGLQFEVVRPRVVTVQAWDLDGNEVVLQGEDRKARVFLHEADHLDGKLFLELLCPTDRKRALTMLRDLDLSRVVSHPRDAAL